ncbi:MAG: SRPBCC domain-containing protein [Acidobacteriota bacterium]|nr:SRPBCC domain-containing protein [Acidobacteriota bacterium]
MRIIAAIVLLLTSLSPARAAVVDSNAGGFTVKVSVTIQAPPDEVYRKFVHNVGEWWNPQHTFSGKSENLSIEDKPQGCWCEKIGANGGARHMQVLAAVPGKALVFSGAMGPMQPLALVGTMDIEFAAENSATKLTLTYTVGGYVPAGANTFAQPTDVVLTDQAERLKNFVELGRPVPPQ